MLTRIPLLPVRRRGRRLEKQHAAESDAFDISERWSQYSNGALKIDYDGLNMTASSGHVYVVGGLANGSNEWF